MDLAWDPGVDAVTRRSRRSPDDGDDGFRWLFTAEYASLVRTVFLIVHDRSLAEDLTQEAFIQLHTHWSKVSDYDQPGAWLRRVAIRLAVREAGRERKHALLARTALRFVPDLTSDPAHIDVVAAVRQLPPRQRSVVVLFYFEDRPMDEIAAILECSVSTGWVHLHRARRRLAALLGEEVGSDER